MKYPSALYRKADEILSERRWKAVDELQKRWEVICKQYQDIQVLRTEISRAGLYYVKHIRETTEASAQLQIRELEAKLVELLSAYGLSTDYLDLQPHCPFCTDKGFVNGHSCECRVHILNQLVYEMLAGNSQLETSTFETFDLTFYDAQTAKKMERLLTSCTRYAEQFTMDSPNLLFMGSPGLGKTHLSLAIAERVVAKGHLVVYATAAQLFQRLVDIAFGDDRDQEYREMVYGCELLIVDDVGTEFKTHITTSEMYTLINTRLNEKRPSILNTNLTMQEIEKTYSNRISSRIVGSYCINEFQGTDIRYQKRRRK